MRDNSGQGKGKNNLRDPTLREHEAAHGHSGRAITGAQKAATKGKRGDSRGDRTD